MNVARWVTIILFFALPAGLLLYAAIRRIAVKSGSKTASWKILLLVLVFGASLVPYATVSLFTGPHDIAYFFLVWVLFYFTRSLPPFRISIIVPIMCGIMLAFPVSTFIYIDGGVMFYNGLPNALQGYGTITGFAYYFALAAAAHYLMASMESGSRAVSARRAG